MPNFDEDKKEDLHLTPNAMLLRLASAKAAIEGRRIGDIITELLKKYVNDEA